MRYKINSKFIVQNAGDQIIVYDSEKSLLYTLNSTASYILKGLKKMWTEDKVADELSGKFHIDKITASEDTKFCITDLLNRNILKPINTERRKEKPSG